jgi:hypothetical protein
MSYYIIDSYGVLIVMVSPAQSFTDTGASTGKSAAIGRSSG